MYIKQIKKRWNTKTIEFHGGSAFWHQQELDAVG